MVAPLLCGAAFLNPLTLRRSYETLRVAHRVSRPRAKWTIRNLGDFQAVQWRLGLLASPRQLRSWLNEGGGTDPLRRRVEWLKCVHSSSLTAMPGKKKIVVAALEWQRSGSASCWASDPQGHSSSKLSLTEGAHLDEKVATVQRSASCG